MTSTAGGRVQNLRKACDLCFTKKIKCNMAKPICSNCVVYKAECRTTTIRRRADPPRVRPVAKSPVETQGNREVKKQLDRIERQLQRVAESNRSAHVESARTPSSPPSRVNGLQSKHVQLESALWRFDPVNPSLYYGQSGEDLFLPPLHDVMPIIENYFQTRNTLLPLFCEDQFMHIVAGWYNESLPRDKVTWSAILMVIALGLRLPAPGKPVIYNSEERLELEDYCMRNAQSVMSELVTRDQDLLGVQVLLALVMLYYNCSDNKPANILIGTAMRLVHRMQLHSNAPAQYFTAEEAKQRYRVFWIAYILDKDVSFMLKSPSIQRDSDIDIPSVLLLFPEGLGLISTEDGQAHLQFFHLRLDLACIQGQIYDLLFSASSMKIQGIERQHRVQTLQTMLDSWYVSIPTEFQMDRVCTTVNDPNMLEMIMGLYNTYLQCVISTNGIYSSGAEWLQKIGPLSRVAMQNFATASHGPRVATFMQNQNPPQPDAWNHCVNISRSSMKLLQEISPSKGLIWQCSCAQVSALIVLLANIIISPAYESILADLRTTMKSIYFSEQFADVVQSRFYKPLQQIILDLYDKATTIVSKVQVDWQDESDPVNNLKIMPCPQDEPRRIVVDITACEGIEQGKHDDLGVLNFDAWVELPIDEL